LPPSDDDEQADAAAAAAEKKAKKFADKARKDAADDKRRKSHLKALRSEPLADAAPKHSSGPLAAASAAELVAPGSPVADDDAADAAAASSPDAAASTRPSSLRESTSPQPRQAASAAFSMSYHTRASIDATVALRQPTATISAILCSTHVFGPWYDALKHGAWLPQDLMSQFKPAYLKEYPAQTKDFSWNVSLCIRWCACAVKITTPS
jgi:hypothetical protein